MADKIKKINKTKIHFKEQENGSILTLHHTIQEDDKLIRVRLVTACFNHDSTHLVAVNHRGTIFALDLVHKKFWKLNDVIPKASIVKHIPRRRSEYVIGTKYGGIAIIDIEKGIVKNANNCSSNQIQNISFVGTANTPESFLIHSDHEAVLVNLTNLEATHRLDFNPSQMLLKCVSYIPNHNEIFTCFTSDTVQIWSGQTLNTTRVLYPIRARDKRLKASQEAASEVSFIDERSKDFDYLLRSEIKDYSKGLINSICFSPDGCFVCLTTVDNYVMIISTVRYEICKLIKLLDTTLTGCAFLPKLNDLILFGITINSDAVILNCNDVAVKAVLSRTNAYKVDVSIDGKLLFLILKSGEVNLFLTSVIFNKLKTTKIFVEELLKNAFRSEKIGVECLDTEVKSLLNRKRLIPMLKEFGHYSDKYRHLIWCSLLDLPCNKSKFVEICQKGVHPCVNDFDDKYQLKDATSLRNLKKLISALGFWSKIFAQCDYLPNFVFPFLKIFPNSGMLNFELMATILQNQCHLMFEFHPMEPVNYLGMCENILTFFDPELANFFHMMEILPKVYAFQMLATAFSEVLDNEQWFHLWDNIISYPSYFPIFVIVAYNVLQRKVLMNLNSRDAIKEFFHDQNIIEVRKLVNKALHLMDKCPENIHPKLYMHDFEKLPKGFYPKFEKYPMQLVEAKENEVEEMRKQNQDMDNKIRELEHSEMEMRQRLDEQVKHDEHTKRMKEVEKLYHEAICREGERITCERKMLLLYQKQIRNRKGKLLELIQDAAARRKLHLHENELDSLMRDIERGRSREETDMIFAEENIKENELNLLAQKYQIDSILNLESTQPLQDKYKKTINKLRCEKIKLTNQLQNITEGKPITHNNTEKGRTRSEYRTTSSNSGSCDDSFSARIRNIEDMVEQIQNEFLRTIQPASN